MLNQADEVESLGERPLLFLHIPKTAGTSFLVVLKNIFGDNNVLRIRRVNEQAKNAIHSVASDVSNPVACLTGHLPIHLFEKSLDRFRTFTILRDPVSRILSLFRFTKHRDTAWIESLGLRPNFSLFEFLQSRHPELHAQTNNDMVRMLTADKKFNDPDCSEFWGDRGASEALTSAIGNLGRIDFGLLEEMGQTLKLAQARWRVPYEIREHHENASTLGVMAPDPSAIKMIEKRNASDLTLYRWAQHAFRERSRMAQQSPKDPTPRDSSWSGQTVFAPTVNKVSLIGDISGRQGFHEVEAETGFAWLCAGQLANIHFVATGETMRLRLHAFCVVRNYPLAAVVVTLNGRRVIHEFDIDSDGRWCWITTESFTTTSGLNIIGIACPLFMQAAELDPEAKDARSLGIAVADVTLLA